MGRVKGRKPVPLALLKNSIQTYAWGSHSVLAELQGRPAPSAQPEAELWMGAHPSAPSRLELPSGERALDRAIAEAPLEALGEEVAEEFDGRLPFLLKVLAAAEPLSLQAHPSRALAYAGFAAEERAGVPRDAPNRNYRDDNHKPELLCALTPFDALCGFRQLAATQLLLKQLGVPELDAFAARLVDVPGLRGVFEELYALSADAAADLERRVSAACRAHREHTLFGSSYGWACRLSDKYAGDIGVVTSLLLNLIQLKPGQALYLPAGNLHAYLEGAGIEIMASSDNVLRGGLTVKHVDVPELMRVLDFSPIDPQPVSVRAPELARQQYVTEAREFCLERVSLEDELMLSRSRPGPEIWLCHSGSATISVGRETLALTRGGSCFIPATSAQLALRGNAVLFRALVGALA